MHWPNGEALFRHPDIVEHFREIFIATVAHEADYPFRFGLLPAISKRARQQGAGGGTAEDSFLAQKLARGGEAVGIVNLKGFSHKRHVSVVRNKILPNSFHRPATRLDQLSRLHPFVEDRAGRIGQHHFHSAARLHPVKKPSESRYGSAGTDPNYDRIHAVPRLLPNPAS